MQRKNAQKVCLICHGLGSGGIESFVVNLAKGLKKNNYDVKLVMAVDDNGIPQFREKEIQDANVETFRTSDLGSLKRICKHCIRLYRYLVDNKFDVVHSNMSLLNGINLAIAWLAGVKVRVAHVHAVGSERSAHGLKNMFDLIYISIMKALIQIFANRKCGCSKAAAEYCYGKECEKRPNVHIVNNGIDLASYSIEKNRSCNKKTLITIGRLAQVKNPDLILQIMCVLKDKGYVLNWVGGGELEQEIDSKIQQLKLSNCINMLGVRKDIAQLLNNADVFLLPSFSEGLPISVIEAQAAGLPCVLSDAVSTEVNCGLCKFISLQESPQKWAEIIDETACGSEELSLNEKSIIKYSIEYMTSQVASIYM